MRILILPLVSLAMFLADVSPSHAQDAPPTWRPLEIFGCTFVEDADMSDLDPVIENWNEWMDERGIDDYFAELLIPNFTATSFPFEILWLGVWENGGAMAGLQQWFTEAEGLEEDFAEVVDCPLHLGMAATNVKPPAEPEGVVPVLFSDCTIHEGRTGPEARRALIEWTEYLTENGSDAGHWILRPGVGEEADASYSFKWVRAYSSYASLGHDFELVYNGGGFARLGDITGRVMSCDYPRVYNSRVLREMAED